MKLISLNTWGGNAGREKLLSFFVNNKSIDVFCLQEVRARSYEEFNGSSVATKTLDESKVMIRALQDISEVLSGHNVYFRPHFLDAYGLVIFSKNNISVTDEGEVFVYKEKGFMPTENLGNHARNIQYITFQTLNGLRTVINFHGLWNGQGKGDSEDRLLQSDKILAFIQTLSNPYVMVGDFNLLPETESLKKLENFGLRNLIKEYDITSTRTKYYNKEHKFADYCLVSKGIEVKDFKVLLDEVSDHSPLYVEFE